MSEHYKKERVEKIDLIKLNLLDKQVNEKMIEKDFFQLVLKSVEDLQDDVIFILAITSDVVFAFLLHKVLDLSRKTDLKNWVR